MSRLVAAGLAALLAAAAAGCGSAATSVSPASPARALVAPAGERVVTFRGLALDVPATWPTRTAGCGGVDHDAVLFGGDLASSCPAQRGPVPIDRYDTLALGGPRPPHTTGTALTVAGLPATRTELPAEASRTETEIDVPRTGAELVFDVADPATMTAILASARQVDVDALGCTTLPPADAPTAAAGSGDGGAVVTPTPTGGAVCTYEGGRLEQSTALTGPTLTRVVAALDRTSGYATAPDPPPSGGCTVSEADMPTPWALLRLTSAAGTQLVTVTVGPCPRGGPGVAGRRQGAVTFELYDDLSQLTPSMDEMPSDPPAGCETAACQLSPPPPSA